MVAANKKNSLEMKIKAILLKLRSFINMACAYIIKGYADSDDAHDYFETHPDKKIEDEEGKK